MATSAASRRSSKVLMKGRSICDRLDAQDQSSRSRQMLAPRAMNAGFLHPWLHFAEIRHSPSGILLHRNNDIERD
ncbi:hypothetical protein IE4872_PC00401 (plasmid) [Rhizobium gallicum]|uniref:Uncharacterized protein n=1 Tax=Rhizobium gallicum TaxID=56730 RepID=A0A1L5NRB6_9HYPH|nr:hypothetical protein IE4872_PC00401 [Rhizobium gallicum]